MAQTQETLQFPLLSLFENHQLLILASEDNKYHRKHLSLSVVQYKESEKNGGKIPTSIVVPKKKSIKAILDSTVALDYFNRAFDDMIRIKYPHYSLRQKLLKVFGESGGRFIGAKNILHCIETLNEKSSVYLLNVKDAEKQFTKISINETTLDKMQKKDPTCSLYFASKSLSDALWATDMAFDDFLMYINKNEALQIHWYLNKFKMSYDIEKTTRNHTLRILKEAIDSPNLTSGIKELTAQLLDNLNEIPELNYQDHLAQQCFLPSFDLPQEALSPELENRILTMATYRTQMDYLNKFEEVLFRNFENDIYYRE